MATSKVGVSEGSGKNLATHSLTEDSMTKEVSRVNLNDSAGVDILGSKTDAKATATDATAVSAISIWKQISASIQALAASLNTNGQKSMANSAPVVVANDQSPIPMLSGVSAAANNLTDSRVVAAASTNATSLKATAGKLYTLDLFNAAAYTVFLKFYNKATSPTVGTDTPVWTVPIPAGAGYSKTFYFGKTFTTGISFAITKLQADNDTTAVAASDVTGFMGWI